MDNIDKKILNEIQSGFPVTSRPYLDLGERIGIPEDEVLKKVKELKKKGIIRRIGGTMSSQKLNFASTLCAARVPGDRVDLFVEKINSFKGVTHNYLRDNSYNIWFTFIAPTHTHIESSLKEISEKTGVYDILNMPAIKMFKIKVDFEV
jgi:siroheme decarboxylase